MPLVLLCISRLAYGEWLIQRLIEECGDVQIHVMYDIACMLKRHLEV